ncbi:MAG: helix-turn-helix domain-containing protein [Chloroflexota bacterium]
MLSAAHSLFVDQGYGATSMAEVARRAGVALKTVYLVFPAKPALLDAVIGTALAGDDRPDSLRGRAWFHETLLASADELVQLFSLRTAELMERAALVLQVAEAAADADPVIRRRRDVARHRRWADIRLVADALARHRPGLDVEAATDVMYTLAAAHNYAQLVGERGWTRERYVAWLAGSLHCSLPIIQSQAQSSIS